jgi:hypothetical protein
LKTIFRSRKDVGYSVDNYSYRNPSKQASFGIELAKNKFNVDLLFYKFVDGITASNQVSTIAFNTPTLMETIPQKVSNFSKYYNS